VEHLARLWQRRETLLRSVIAVEERMKEARPELLPAAQAWVAWAEACLDDHRPTDPLFFEPLLDRKAPGFHHYRWTGGYGERDEGLERWRWWSSWRQFRFHNASPMGAEPHTVASFPAALDCIGLRSEFPLLPQQVDRRVYQQFHDE
jgi:hypothetical protein